MFRHLFVIFTGLLCFTSGLAWAQQQAPKRPCDTEAGQKFDFWIGKWDVSWKDGQGNVQKGSNHVRKVLGDCIIEENFTGGPLKGRSYSVYNTQTKLWQQTWVDNQGSYLVFTGTFENGEMTLVGEPKKNKEGKEVVQRMVFKEIQKDSLIWHWQGSTDKGKTWKDLWVINYERATS
jgi:hypothetical protein